VRRPEGLADGFGDGVIGIAQIKVLLAHKIAKRDLAEVDKRIVIDKTLAVYDELLPRFEKSPDVHRV
jgi:hypothetical protein